MNKYKTLLALFPNLTFLAGRGVCVRWAATTWFTAERGGFVCVARFSPVTTLPPPFLLRPPPSQQGPVRALLYTGVRFSGLCAWEPAPGSLCGAEEGPRVY